VLPGEIRVHPSDFEAVKAQAGRGALYTLSYIGAAPRSIRLRHRGRPGLRRAPPGGLAVNQALEMTRRGAVVSGDEPIRALSLGVRRADRERRGTCGRGPGPLSPERARRGPDGRSYCDLSANYRWREGMDPTEFMDMPRVRTQEGGALAALSGDLLDVRVAYARAKWPRAGSP
jgi:hypothetical protein